jgi:hypothetical protein
VFILSGAGLLATAGNLSHASSQQRDAVLDAGVADMLSALWPICSVRRKSFAFTMEVRLTGSGKTAGRQCVLRISAVGGGVGGHDTRRGRVYTAVDTKTHVVATCVPPAAAAATAVA